MTSLVYKINDDLSNLQEVLQDYDRKLKHLRSELGVDMKTYALALSQQSGLIAYYANLEEELEILANDMKMRFNVQRAETMKKIHRSSSRDYTEKQLNMMIDVDENVIAAYKAMKEVEERHRKASSLVGAFIQRGHSLRNLVAAREGGFQDELIYVNE